MRMPVVTLVINSSSVRSFNARMPSVLETVGRVVGSVQAGALNVHQPVSAQHADQVLTQLVDAINRADLRVLIALPSGEVVDSGDSVMRPAASVTTLRFG